MATKVGHGLAKVLGIKLQYRNPTGQEALTRGESVFSVSTADTFVEEEPTSLEWISQVAPTPRTFANWAYHLFPFTHWIGRYNGTWLIGDLVAGITVGCVVVPQSMAYAKLADLPVQYGLYSSFMGVLIYWFFATSKDITIGPVAVLSTVTGTVVLEAAKTHPHIPGHVVASALAVIDGAIICFIGLIRCGWIVDFISLAAISAYMTGSALNIAVGQVPALMGITGFSNRDATYKVVINILKHLGRTKIDAAMGLTALAMLYMIRSACNFGARKVPHRAKTFFFISTLRTSFVILLYTMISWLVNRHHRPTKDNIFAILGTVPRGFKAAAVPTVNKTVIQSFASQLPATVIVTLIEHIAIAKSFGRVNNYTIDPSQEMVAIGISNLLGPFLGAYPATGSFSRTAIKSKAGVRTPLAGVITALVVLLSIYALPAVFFYIPNASLSAVIIHAVGDLITPPNTVYQFWRISPLEVIIFFAGVLVTIFASIEDGIYTTICISVAVLLFRVVKAKGRFLGKVKIHSVIGDHLMDHEGKHAGRDQYDSFGSNDPDKSTRNLFLPISHNDGSNPEVDVESPYPGIFIYRFSEGFNYPNATHYLDYMVATIFKETRRTNPSFYPKLGDRPWNDPGPRRGKPIPIEPEKPTLKAIILDFSSVNNVDITSVQHLIDVRNQLDRYAAPDTVDWHLACINNRWTKRALSSAGFGFPTPQGDASGFERWKPIFSVAEIGGQHSAAAAAEYNDNEKELKRQRTEEARSRSVGGNKVDGNPHVHDTASSTSGSDLGQQLESSKAYGGVKLPAARVTVLHGLNRPLFHIDLTSALQSAITNVEMRGEGVVVKGVGTEGV
ncbi:MAG: Sulfate permease 2 [Alectoria fallacina]|uniref:Sulfate permease 2 n=1 Tax=Alectoria fallacina TaxID=1903189 RepID=A0A8H3I8H6_9LECA|nr:MAG: Sulfate permease 2 [Alectoria fallacina]